MVAKQNVLVNKNRAFLKFFLIKKIKYPFFALSYCKRIQREKDKN